MASEVATVVVGVLSVMTWAVTRTVLEEHSTLRNPLIPVCVGVLAFISLMEMREAVAALIAPLYATLAIAILLLLFLIGIYGGKHSGRGRETPSGEGRDVTKRREREDPDEPDRKWRKDAKPPWPR